MGTHEEINVGVTTASQFKRQAEETETGFSSSALYSQSQTDEALIDKFQNVSLSSSFDNDHKDSGGSHGSSVLPLRPYAGDCPHYTRTGMCKFGLTCKFNHPVKRTNLVVQDKNWSSHKAGQIECKLELWPSKSKFGRRVLE